MRTYFAILSLQEIVISDIVVVLLTFNRIITCTHPCGFVSAFNLPMGNLYVSSQQENARTTRTAQLKMVTDAARTAIVSAPSTHVVRRAGVDSNCVFLPW